LLILLSWIASLGSIGAYFLNIFKLRACFIVWIISNGILVVLTFMAQEYAYTLMWIVYIGLSVYGWIMWSPARARQIRPADTCVDCLFCEKNYCVQHETVIEGVSTCGLFERKNNA